MPISQAVVRFGGAELVLLPNRIVWWPDQRALLLADAHFGKAATFRKSGLPVPSGTTRRMLDELSHALALTEARSLFVLGDLIHSTTRARRDFEEELLEWRQRHSTVPIALIRGNHDRHAEDLFTELRLEVHNEPLEFEKLVLCHDPLSACSDDPQGYWVGGHIHPGCRVAGGKGKLLPCFWRSGRCLVLPAFGQFTGLAAITPGQGDDVFVLSENQIAEVHRSPRAM
ncbi:MAG: ligase-associated DNA damage response endonuclease PdeM [Aureliella sp.]